MKTLKISGIGLAVCLSFSTAPAQAEAVGKVIAVAGDATVQRQGQDISLAIGTVVESGDLFKVGEPGNVQIRFNDEAIVALRSNSQLRVDNYVFANKPDTDTSVLSLLKGGMRTITGLIGRVSRSNYSVKTQTSTIGIRGTHFSLVQCDNDCRNADGSVAANGTFGGVTDGRIAVANDAGEREFGKSEFFFVANRSALPEGLLAPPSFLRDRLEGQAKSSKGQGSGGKEASGKLAKTANAAASTAPQLSAEMPAPQIVSVIASEQPAITQNVVNPFVGFSNFAVAGVHYGSQNSFSENTLLLEDPYRSSEVVRLQGVFPVALSASTDTGYSEIAGQVHWGHWYGTGASVGGYGEHWAVGTPTPLAGVPSAGIHTYEWVGGTRPTDNFGNVGSITSGGSLSVSFDSRTVNTIKPVSWTVGGHAYTLSLSNLDWSVAGSGTRTFTCDGCSSVSGDVAGQFTGNNAEGAVAGIYTRAAYTNGETQETAQVQVYARDVAAAPPPSQQPTTPVPVPTPTPTPPPLTPTPTPPTTPTATLPSYVDQCASFPCTYSYAMTMASALRYQETTATTSVNSLESDSSALQFEVTASSKSSAPLLNPIDPLGGTNTTGSNTGSVEDAGSSAVANLYWGRYSYSFSDQQTGYTEQESGSAHYIQGDALTNMPTAGIYTYNHIGGTQPTDQLGNAGTLNNPGSWVVDFNTRMMGTASAVNWSVNGVTYNLTVPSQTWATQSGTYSEPGAYSVNLTHTPGMTQFNLDCAPACTRVTGTDIGNKVSPALFGANAEALGVGYATNVQVNGTNHVTAHVQAYKR